MDCKTEYGEINFAFQQTMLPDIDKQRAKAVMEQSWLPKVTSQPDPPPPTARIDFAQERATRALPLSWPAATGGRRPDVAIPVAAGDKDRPEGRCKSLKSTLVSRRPTRQHCLAHDRAAAAASSTELPN